MLDRLRRLIRSTRAAPPPEATRGFEAAGAGHRWAGLQPSDLKVAAPLSAQLIASRAEHAWANDPYARRGVDIAVSSLHGVGFRPRPGHPDAAMRKRLVQLYDGFNPIADVTGRTSLDGLARQACRNLVVRGEAFIRLVVHPDFQQLPLRLQGLDPRVVDFDLTRHEVGRPEIENGIELDPWGRPVAYHLRQDDGYSTVRVDAGEIIHVADAFAVGLRRGVSWLAPVLLRLHELDQYEDAALVRSRVANLLVGVLTDPDGEGLGVTGSTASGTPMGAMAPGTILTAPPGKGIEFSKPPETAGYSDFVKAHLRGIAAGLGLTYEQLSADYSDVNFSSARAALIEHRRWVEQVQYTVLIPQLYQPIWERFVRTAAIAGLLPIDELDDLLRVDWLPPRFDYVNPTDEVEADIAAIGAGIKSREQVIAERGWDIEQIDAQLAADRFKPAEAKP